LAAFLAPDELPRALLAEHADALPDPLAAAVGDRLGFQQVLGALRHYSLATVTADTLSVHRLVQAVVRHALDPALARTWAAAAVSLVRAGFSDQAHDNETWPPSARLLFHAQAATDHADLLGADPPATAGLPTEAGHYLTGRAEHTQAKTLHQRALSIRETELGPRDPDTADSHQNLGVVLRDLGAIKAARTHHERALAILEMRHGPAHPRTAASLQSLARDLHLQGDLDVPALCMNVA
jgi:hypothetical protein